MASDWLNTAANVFQSVGTVGAFITGFVLLRREHRRDAARDEESRRSQAARVSAWVELHTLADGSRQLDFHVRNSSDMPIYEVEIVLPSPTGGEPDSEFVGLVPPGLEIRRTAPRSWMASYTQPEPVEIEFFDSAGWQWSRDEQGNLTRAAQRAISQRQ